MSWMAGIRARLAQGLNRSASESRVEEEFQFHLEMERERLESEGLSAGEARRQAALSFGGLEGHREEVREQRKIPLLEDLGRDLGYGVRALRRSPGYTVAAVLALALGIAGTTTIFGVVDSLFLRYPAGIVAPERLVRLLVVRDEGNINSPAGNPARYLDFESLREASSSFTGVAASTWPARMDLGRGAEVTQVTGSAVSGNYFDLLGVAPAEGRLFGPQDDEVEGGSPMAVLSHGLWKSAFGGNPEVVGRGIWLNGKQVTVLGVAGERFAGAELEPTAIWVTTSMAHDLGVVPFPRDDISFSVNLIGRLRPGVTRESAASAAVGHLPTGSAWGPELDPTPGLLAISLAVGDFPSLSQWTNTTFWLGGASFFLLLIACSNVGNMLLARGAARRREMAVRVALGAGRRRLVRQLLSESLLLAGLGGALAVLLTYAAGGLVRQFELPAVAGAVNLRVVGFALLVCVASTFVFGLVPALRAMPASVSSQLSSRSDARSAGGSRVRKLLVAGQVAIACVLLVGAGLFVRSLLRVYAVDTGIRIEGLSVATVDLARSGYGREDQVAFYRDARERLAGLPGVEAAGLALFTPLAGGSIRMGWTDLAGQDIPQDQWPTQNWIAGDYFRAIGTPFISPPADPAGELAGSEGTVVVSRAMAGLLEPGGEVTGRCLRRQRRQSCLTILGVVEDSRQNYLDPAVTPMIYLSWEKGEDVPDWSPPSLFVRTSSGSPTGPEEIRAALQTLRPDLPFIQVESMEARVRQQMSVYRLGSTFFTVFGVLALTLAAIGTYAVLSYFVVERRPEIGVRRSIGAPAGAVVRLMLKEGVLPVMAGTIAGLGLALLGTRYLEPLLFSTSTRDLATFVGVGVVLFAAGLVAVLIPTRRALVIDPAEAMRAE